MKAVVFETYGSADHLAVREVARPEPEPGESWRRQPTLAAGALDRLGRVPTALRGRRSDPPPRPQAVPHGCFASCSPTPFTNPAGAAPDLPWSSRKKGIRRTKKV